jgi:hypothetical protein
MVVVAIIILMLGIGVAVMQRANSAAFDRQSRLILSQLAGIESELRIQRNNEIYDPSTFGTSWTGALNAQVPPKKNTSITAFLNEAYKYSTTREMIARIDNRLIAGWTDRTQGPSSGGNAATVNDAFNNVIQYRSIQAAPAKVHNDTTTEPDPGMVPPYPYPYFASPGADGKFGNYQADGSPEETSPGSGALTAKGELAKDNLLSFKREGSQ